MMLRISIIYPLLLKLCLTLEVSTHLKPPIVMPLNYNELYNFQVNSSLEYIFEFSGNRSSGPPRISIVNEDADRLFPLMVVARQPKEMLSFQLPLMVETVSGVQYFSKSSRTLCHDIIKRVQHYKMKKHVSYDDPIVTVSTAAPHNVPFSLKMEFQEHFHIKPSKEYKFSISASEPRYFLYNFTDTSFTKSKDSDYDTVILEVFSDDEVCMTVSIQNVTCPVFDLNQDITFRGFYETVNKKGGITIPKYKFPHGFFVVFVAKGDNYDCTKAIEIPDSYPLKNITLIIKPSITYSDYVNAVLITLGCIGAFYFVFGVSFFFCSRHAYIPRQLQYVDHSSVSTANTNVTGIDDAVVGEGEDTVTDNISINEAEYDRLPEAETDKEIRLGKSIIYVSDLATKNPAKLKQKSNLYLYNVLTIALFYGLPVVQLVITYQKVLNNTGQQDLCYYNFLCAHPVGQISDFNHLFSNIGYVLLGILFLWITYRRSITHKDEDFDRAYGIPQHYGMFYAMGFALVMEGVLSGSYHICPNQANFQFDSSFMYIMAVLSIVKLYQNRHPDINASAYSTFGLLAVVILLGMIGVFEDNIYFRTFFVIVYLFSCFIISVQVYYMGCWKLDRGTVVRVFNICAHDFWSGPLNVVRPTYKARMILLVIVNVWNCFLAFALLYFYENRFPLYLLAICMSNTLLYFIFYIVMKYLHKERVNVLSWIFLALSTTCAISAMYFFVHKGISWTNTPAISRQFNQECKLLRFYDFHDIWHFLSAVGMFFTFMVLLTLDDDLSHTHRSQIVVF